jgi:hypothetical protein
MDCTAAAGAFAPSAILQDEREFAQFSFHLSRIGKYEVSIDMLWVAPEHLIERIEMAASNSPFPLSTPLARL